MRTEVITSPILPVVLSWWPARGVGEMQEVLLPPDGVVALDDAGQPIVAAWLCLIEGTPLAWVDWLVAMPGIGAREIREGGKAVFAHLEAIAREKGRRMLFAAACRHSMVREIEGCGFVVMARDVVHLAKPLPS